MNKTKISNGFKIVLIFFLVLAISFLVLMQWKSDAIVRKAVGMLQDQLEDSLHYENISLEWVRYFPSAALQLEGLQIGNAKDPLITGGNVAVVLRLFPLFNEKVIINKLIISDSRINITKHNGRWTYDLFKKRTPTIPYQSADATTSTDSTGWETMIKQVKFENTIVSFDNREGINFSIDIKQGELKGDLGLDHFDADITMTTSLEHLAMENYNMVQPFPFDMNGHFTYDAATGTQELKDWEIKNDDMDLEMNGIIRTEDDHQWLDLQIGWMDTDPQIFKTLLPAQDIKNWSAYSFSGKSEGELSIKGTSSKKETPHIALSTELKNGSIKFPGDGGQLKNMILNMAFDNGEANSKKPSYFRANLRSGSFQGNTLKADMRMENLKQPVMDLEMSGALPASILNLFMDSTSWNFKEGVFDIDHYKIDKLSINTISTKTFIQKSSAELTADHVRLVYNGDEIEINKGDINLDEVGKMKVNVNEFIWNKATGKDIEGELIFEGDKMDFDLTANHSQGQVHTKGTLNGIEDKPVLSADWNIKGIEMKELLTSFENFDQTFITSEQLNGKTDIWAHSIIPYDADGNIRQRDILVRAAIDIRDGELKDLKTLEDFGTYVHLDDLREIHFNHFRNYMKIEDGKVFLPVMFIQSSAINMSVNGVHSFDQNILYNLKINAGQAATNKLKKLDPLKKFKQARKSGWINLYFVLSGNVDNVQYEQDQKQVVSAFEQSRQLKETLRNYLVDRFGHDVYWLEPNEWEDIPEYK